MCVWLCVIPENCDNQGAIVVCGVWCGVGGCDMWWRYYLESGK